MLWICTSSFSLEKGATISYTIGTCAIIWRRPSIFRYRDYSSVRMLGKSLPISFPSPCLCLCPCLCPYLCPCSCPCSCPCPCPCPCPCLKLFFLSSFFLYGEYNFQCGNYPVDSQGLCEVARKLEWPLTWECMVKINWKSQHLRSIDWYHFQPNEFWWTVPFRKTEIVNCWEHQILRALTVESVNF